MLASPEAAGATLAIRFAGSVQCVMFPYGCHAALSLLEPGTVVDADWRPPDTDTRFFAPTSAGTSSDHLDPTPWGDLPRPAVGRHELVLSLLGSYDVPSYRPDGTLATDLLSRCSAEIDVTEASRMVDVLVTFTPNGVDFGGTCELVAVSGG